MRRVGLLAVATASMLATGLGAQERVRGEAELAADFEEPAEPAGRAAPSGGRYVGEESPLCIGCGGAKRSPAPAGVAATRPIAPTTAVRRARAAAASAPAYRSGARRPAAARAGVSVAPLAFANGSAELAPSARRQMDEYARLFTNPGRSLSGARFLIAGHTNSVGSRGSNLDLSKRRAEAVVDYLVAQGVARDRLEAVGRGPDEPLAGRAAADAANRRVEIVRR